MAFCQFQCRALIRKFEAQAVALSRSHCQCWRGGALLVFERALFATDRAEPWPFSAGYRAELSRKLCHGQGRPVFATDRAERSRHFSGTLLRESVETGCGGVFCDFSGFIVFIAGSVEFVALEEGGTLKGTDPKNTVEMMLASTLPLVGQR